MSEITLGANLHIPSYCPARYALTDSLTFPNPKYESVKKHARNPHYAIQSVDPYVRYWQEDMSKGQVIMPVGVKDKLYSYCVGCSYNCQVKDVRTLGTRPEERRPLISQLRLRPSQERAYEAAVQTIGMGGTGLLQLPTGCHSKGTKILMFNGEFKNVEEITVGDQIMGPDSQPRNVLKLHRGRDVMYRVRPKHGKEFIVNSEHILSLVTTSNSPNNTANKVNLSIKEYLKKSKWFKHCHKLYLAPELTFPQTLESENLEIDPYMLGVLLGDGCIKYGSAVCSMDPEIIDYTVRFGQEHGLNVSVCDQVNNKSKMIKITSPYGRGSSHTNWLINQLKILGIYGKDCYTKSIPAHYLRSSVQNRRELLAGLIDTDGECYGPNFKFSTASKQLADDVEYLASSLGLVCRRGKNDYRERKHYGLSILGDCAKIPTKISRKKAYVRTQIKNPDRTSFTLEQLPEDDYYGFSVDGDNLYVMEGFWVTHNCGKTILGFYISHQARQNTLFVTHTKDLMYQTADSYERLFGVRPGLIGDGKYEPDPHFTVAIIDSLHRRKLYGEWNELYGFIMMDETHRMPTVKCHEFLSNMTVKYKLGLSATLNRGDGLGDAIFSAFGAIAYKVTIPEAMEEGSLVPLEASVYETNYIASNSAQSASKRTGFKILEKEAAHDVKRNQLITEIVSKKAEEGETSILVLNSLDQCKVLHDMFQTRAEGIVSSAIFTGEQGPAERKQIVTDTKEGRVNALLTVQLAGMGLDIPQATHLLMDRKISDPLSVEQIVGRVVRACPEIGKTKATLTDMYDVKFAPFANQTRKRFDVYNKFRERTV